MKEDSILRSALSEILKGYSYDFENSLYIKHMCLDDYVNYERIYSHFYTRLENRGVESSEKLIDRAISQGLWSDHKQSEMDELEGLCKQLRDTVDKALAKDMKDHARKELRENESKYYNFLNQKESITSSSIENLTDKRMNEYYIINSLYEDELLTRKKFNEKDFNEIEQDELSKFIKSYNKYISKFAISNIKKVVIKSFFRESWDLVDNSYYYFGKPISKISYYQSHLANHAIIFGGIFKNYPDIDSEDPDEIIEFAKMRQEASRQGGKNRTFVGMDSDKMKRAGLKTPDRSAQFSKKEL